MRFLGGFNFFHEVFLTGVQKMSDLKYSTDALDNTLYESGEPLNHKKNFSKKPKKDLDKRPNLNLMPPTEISDYILSVIRKTKKQLSPVEVEDLRPPMTSLSSYFEEGNGSNLFDCVRMHMPELKKVSGDKSIAMSVLIISSSAIRATELIRQLGSLRQDYGVGKCFAKHFKMEEQLKFFNSKCPAISIGTPNRFSKLFASGHTYFTMDSVRICIIDTYRDLKQRNIFEIPETCSDLLEFYISNILPALKTGTTKLIFF